jgi:amidase
MARTVPDLTLLFATLAGHHPLEPGSHAIPLRRPTLAELRAQTIGYFFDDGLVPVTPETRHAVQLAADALRAHGFRVEPVPPSILEPLLEPLRQLWWKLFVQCGALFYEPAIQDQHHRLSPIFQEFLHLAGQSPALATRDLLSAWADLDLLRAAFQSSMQPYPILLCPVSSIPAFRHGERTWQVEGQAVHYFDAMRFTQWFNVLAAPATVVPMTLSPENLPIGIQVVAQPCQDETTLAIASLLNSN